jgi:hypothetical protein
MAAISPYVTSTVEMRLNNFSLNKSHMLRYFRKIQMHWEPFQSQDFFQNQTYTPWNIDEKWAG